LQKLHFTKSLYKEYSHSQTFLHRLTLRRK